MNYKYSILSVLITLAITSLIAKSPELRGPQWSRVSVEEAFISRRTSIQYRDEFSAAEFGWRLKQGKKILGRGALYPTLYAPFTLKQELRMELIERDLFVDDLVAGFKLGSSPGRIKYTVTRNGDFAIVTRSAFYPEAKSGPDYLPGGASVLLGNRFVQGSVSFLGRDYTDHFRLPGGETSILLVYNGILKFNLLKNNYAVLKGGDNIFRTYIILEGNRPDHLRLRGKAAGGIVKYSLFRATGPARKKKLRSMFLRRLLDESRVFSKSDFRAFALLMNKFDRPGTLDVCRMYTKRRSSERIPCGFFLYRYGSEQDFQMLEKLFPGESKEYQDTLRSLRGEILKKRKPLKKPGLKSTPN